MKFFITAYRELRSVSKTEYMLYCFIYGIWGIGMNAFGIWAEIARFTYWWQIITCYILYMIPVSVLLRFYSFFTQYAYGLVAMGILEFLGYALHTSYAYPNTILDQWFSPQNFALSMALFFALYIPLGNQVIRFLYQTIFLQKKSTPNS